jgi:hypothetical protein
MDKGRLASQGHHCTFVRSEEQTALDFHDRLEAIGDEAALRRVRLEEEIATLKAGEMILAG